MAVCPHNPDSFAFVPLFPEALVVRLGLGEVSKMGYAEIVEKLEAMRRQGFVFSGA